MRGVDKSKLTTFSILQKPKEPKSYSLYIGAVYTVYIVANNLESHKRHNWTNYFSPKRAIYYVEYWVKHIEISVDFFKTPMLMLPIEVTNRVLLLLHKNIFK